MRFEYPPGATPIDPDEAEGLLLPLETQAQLNEAESLNIENATVAMLSRPAPQTFPTDVLLRDLHRRMFDQVWMWAGAYRNSNKSIGVDKSTISEQIRNLCLDARARRDAQDDGDELCAWFHWRLVWIHAFVNGNGRHARLATDQLRRLLRLPPWAWGNQSLDREGETRSAYIAALKAADDGNLRPLLAFVGAS